jgi:hypothetical protein
MRPRAWLLILSFALAVVLSGISCYDDDYWDDDDYCHYDQNGYWHCHDDDDDFHHAHARTDGVVIVLITDHPMADVTAFYVTITEVTLFETETGPVSLYRSETGLRLDLLSLRGSSGGRLHELLAARALASGVYDSIRLTLRDPAVTLSSGEVLEGPDLDLAGNGRIDIDLAEHLLLGPDETIHVVLDIDVPASIGSAPLSERGKVSPVVLADVLYADIEKEARLRTDVGGTLHERDPESGLYRLELPEERGEVRARVLDEAEILDRALRPAPSGVLSAGSEVVARGVLRAREVDLERIALDPGPGRVPQPGELEPPAVPLTAPIEGSVASVAPDERTLIVAVDGTPRSITVPPDAPIVVVEVSDDGLRQSSILLRQVEVGANVKVQVDSGSPRLVIVTRDG